MTRRVLRLPLFVAPAIVAAAIFLAYLFIWLAGARQMRVAVEDFAQEQGARGNAVSVGRFAASGFPFFLRGALKDFEIAAGAWRVAAPEAFIDADPLRPSRLVVSARKPFVVNFGGEGEWRIEAPDARLAVARDKERGWRLDVEAGAGRLIRIDREGAVAMNSFLLSAAPSAADAARIFVGVNAAGVTLSEPGRHAAFDAVDLAFAISGATGEATSLRAWRDGGGAVDIQSAAAARGASRAEIRGEVAIDAQGYPAGRLDASIGDPAAFADALAAAGIIRSKDAGAARAALALIAIAGGGKVAAPIQLEDGEARLAGLRIAKLRPVIPGPESRQP